jgi:Trypsin-like peptidase domain/Colicin V production protein
LTTLDWIIVVFTVLMAGWGYMQGLIVGALSLAGFAGGAVLGSRVGPLLLDEGSASPYAPLAALVGALLAGGLLAAVLEMLGFHLRVRLGSKLGVLDGLGGLMLVACLGLGVVWIIGAVALHTPGASDLRKPIQRSKILRNLNGALPPSGPLLKTLARFDPFPRITGPIPRVGPPNAAIARDPQVRAASRSVVKVLGTACGLGVQGSGWVAGNGIVVTNAHVVAGQDDTTVQVGGVGDRHSADAIWFDPRNDIAILRSSGVSGTPALGLNLNARTGTAAAVLGFPGNGPYDVQPARLGPTQTFLSQDAYGRGPIRRRVTSVRGTVRGGNSGGPTVDGSGRVLTTIFAASRRTGAGFGVPDSVAQEALQRARGSVDTGPCAR